MSASLVGSEMCIRDRLQGSRHERSRAPARPASASAPAGTSAAGARIGAVSYTHLTLPTICSV
eukprot:5699667-Alexandrium_andersonii.AAC.1